MNARQIAELLRNPPAELVAQCVPGMRCAEYESEKLFQFRRHRGLEPIRLGLYYYLLPTRGPCSGLAQEINSCRNVIDTFLAASVLCDYLVEEDIPVPPPILALLDQARRADKHALVRGHLQSGETRKLSNREIARRCGCSEGLVRKIRAQPSAYGTQMGDTIQVRRGGSTYTMQRRATRRSSDASSPR
jgi:hypothetical protein